MGLPADAGRSGEFMTREEVAREWFEQEYVPVVAMLREAG